MSRTFRYTSATYQSFRVNPQHQLAVRHAMLLFRSKTIYSFIPKNACSTLRLTLAIENGFIQKPSDFNWIHQNNDAFGADLPALATAPYTFVVLRCPFARIASAFLDKIVGHTVEAWQMYEAIKRSREISSFTFDFFVRQLAAPAIRNSNIHWRPQVDFLLYHEYDDYFCLEQFEVAVQTLHQKIGVTVVDARQLSSHGLDRYETIDDGSSFTHASALEIMNLKAAGKCPSLISLYSPELVAIVRNCYQQDFDLYLRQFGADHLLFAPIGVA